MRRNLLKSQLTKLALAICFAGSVSEKALSAAPAISREQYETARRLGGAFASYLMQDYPVALKDLRPLAENGNRDSQYLLGRMYRYGQGVPKDDKIAVDWFQKAANLGFADAQFSLGEMYEEGQGVEKDYSKAGEMYRYAADQGHAEAAYNLAAMLYSGKGILQDYEAAAGWFRLAADQGLAEAQYGLGVLYENGQGLPKNLVLAHVWLNLAASRYDATEEKARASAASIRSALEAQMTAQQVSEAQKEARQWKAHCPLTSGKCADDMDLQVWGH